MSDTSYPDNAPPMPKSLRGVATVKGQTPNTFYTVDFNTGVCDCQQGQAWRWDNKRWVPGNLCNHKLKAIASKLEQDPDQELFDYYEASVGKRHNAFVAVSAMHKELRRGDVEASLYWAVCMIPHRGTVGVINYLRNIVFEETRDLALYAYLLKLSSYGKSVSRLDMCRAIARFAKAPKKWELPWRLETFINEQKAYQELVKRYGTDVAKPSDIIPEAHHRSLHSLIIGGFKSGSVVSVQTGLKGLLKSKASNNDKLRIAIFNYLTDVLNGEFENKFEHDADYSNRLHERILYRINHYGAPGYHELNALCDALTGEPGDLPTTTLPPTEHKRIVNSPRSYSLPLGDFRRIPLYANDNHTWPGKALLRQYGDSELQPGAEQHHIDYRYCGAYAGVAWRLLAYRQHATIDCKWSEVSWRQPPWLWGHVSAMFY